MRIWIDIVNSPHVHFFRPLIKELCERGHEVYVTAREFAQTAGLLEKFKIPFTMIGEHAGSRIVMKVADVFKRGAQLRAYAQEHKFDRALTFNSPSMVVAAKWLRVPSMVFMDYEYQPLNHLTFRVSDVVVTPTCFPKASLLRCGALAKTVTYDGLKEQVYLSHFQADENFMNDLSLDHTRIIITVRPPATMALYHRFENELFYDVVKHLLKSDRVTVIAVPRSLEQRRVFESLQDSNLVMPTNVVDGRNLVYHSDLVVGAGGTMTREAAILGTPSYTLFKGRIGAVDKYLIKLGRIVPIQSWKDVEKIKIAKVKKRDVLSNPSIISTIVYYILHT